MNPDLDMLQAELERLGIVNRELRRAVSERDAVIALQKKQLLDLAMVELRDAAKAEPQRVAEAVFVRQCNHCRHVDVFTLDTETDACGACGTEANPVMRRVGVAG